MDDLVSMAMFARVVEAKSFTAAALQLGVSKSLLSKRISALEERVRTPLLRRTTRRLSLTTEGARMHEHCLAMLRAADDAALFSEARDREPRGVLRISCSQVVSELYLNRALCDFAAAYPAVQVEVSASNQIVDLVAERIDLAVRMSPTLESSSLVARRFAVSKKTLCASPAYLRARGTPRTPDQLRAHACLRFSPIAHNVEWRFGDTVVPCSGPIISDNADTLRHCAIAGLGIVNLPFGYIADDIASGRLVRILEDHPQPTRGVYAVYMKGRVVPAKIRKFIDHLVRVD
jgi:DNA-binding transcriptional LysR family regulator